MTRPWLLGLATATVLAAFGHPLAAQEGSTLTISDVAAPTANTIIPTESASLRTEATSSSTSFDPTSFVSSFIGKGEKGCGCGSASKCGCDPCEPWTLFPQFGCRIQVGGWINGGVTLNGEGNRSGTGNFPVEFNNMSDAPVANQIWGFIKRDLDTSHGGLDWGFRADYVFGSDGPDTQAFGDQDWDFGWNTSRDYGSAIPQLYFELGYNDFSIKIGHFFTLIGYEVVMAPENFFYSHSLTMFYGEPFTHTGALATYEVNDCWTLYGGYVTGWDSGFANRFDANQGIGGVTWSPREAISLTYATVIGDHGDGTRNPLNVGDIYMHSIVLDLDLTDRLKYVFQSDYATNFNVPNNGNNQWYGANNYLFYTINDCWAAGIRGEWFRDQDGARIGTTGDYYEVTAGVRWTPRANIIIRPEIRWDFFDGNGTPFDNGNEDRLTTFGIDGILTF